MDIIEQLKRIADALEAENNIATHMFDANQRQHDESKESSRAWLEWNKQMRAEDMERSAQNRASDLARVAKEHADLMHSKELDRSVSIRLAEMGIEVQREHDAALLAIDFKREQEVTTKSGTRASRVAKAIGPVMDEDVKRLPEKD
jgi:hypothetical protein